MGRNIKKGNWNTVSSSQDGSKAVTNVDAEICDSMLRLQLADVRKSKHLTQKQVSELSGLSESCISNIENPNSPSSPTMRSLIRYATALNIELYINMTPGEKPKI